MPRIIWSAPSVADLDRIEDWLTEHRSAEFTARTIRLVRERADWLRNFPHGGRPSNGFRIVRVYNTRYLFIYQIAAEAVEIIRVHHEREDWQMTF